MKGNLRKFLSLLVAAAMLITLLPTAAFAAEGDAATVTSADGSKVTSYATLQDAINAAKDGETIKILKDIELSSGISPKTSVTFKGDEKNKPTISGATGLFSITADKKIKLENLKLQISNDGGYYIYIDNGSLDMINCDITVAQGTNYVGNIVMNDGKRPLNLENNTITANARVAIAGIGDGSVIRGNVFDSISEVYYPTKDAESHSRTSVLSLTTTAAGTAIITGNTFKNANRVLAVDNAPDTLGENITFKNNKFINTRYAFELSPEKNSGKTYDISENYYSFNGTVSAPKVENAEASGSHFDGTTEYTAKTGIQIDSYYTNEQMTTSKMLTKNYAATVVRTNYATFKEAVAKAKTNQTIKILRDVQLSEVIEIDKNVTINLNGHKIINNLVGGRPIHITTAAKVTINGYTAGGGMVTSLAADGRTYGFIDAEVPGVSLTLAGGTYEGNTDRGALIRVRNTDNTYNDTRTITLTKVTATTNTGVLSTDTCGTINVKVTGGNYTATNSVANGDEMYNVLSVDCYNGGMTCDGVTVTTNGGACVEHTGGTGTFTNCNFTVNAESDPGYTASAIAASWEAVVTLESGEYTSAGYGAYVYNSGGTINIKDGATITGGVNAVRADTSADYKIESNVNISGGIINGDILVNSDGNVPATLKITGGTVNGSMATNEQDTAVIAVSGGTFNQTFNEKYCVEGFKVVDGETAGTFQVQADADKAFKITRVTADGKESINYYATLGAAVEAATEKETIVLLRDTINDGVVVPSGKDITIDFGGHTYTINNETVGSTGTETCGFQLLKDSNITFKNGTIKADPNATNLKVMIQNYSNLTLEDMNVDGSANENVQYVLSCNNGASALKGNTNLTAPTGQTAMDVYYWPSKTYESVSLTLDETMTGTVTGNVSYGDDNSETNAETIANNAKLIVQAGTINGSIAEYGEILKSEATGIEISGGTFSKAFKEEYCTEGLSPVGTSDGKYTVEATNTENMAAIKTNINTGATAYYTTLSDAIKNAQDGDTITLLKDDVTEGMYSFTAGTSTVPKNIFVDLATHTMESKKTSFKEKESVIKVDNYVNVTFRNGSIKHHSPTPSSGAYGLFYVYKSCDVKLVGVTMEYSGKSSATNGPLINFTTTSGSKVAADNCTITISEPLVSVVGQPAAQGTVTVNNSTVNLAGPLRYATFVNSEITCGNIGDATCTNCNIESSGNAGAGNTISGGSITCKMIGLGTTCKDGAIVTTKHITAGTFSDVTLNGVVAGGITGGTFTAAGAADMKDTALIGEGYVQNADTGKVEAQVVAEVDGTQYTSIQKAVDAIPRNGSGTVKLISNVTISSAIKITSNRDVTLDLNGHTINRSLPQVGSNDFMAVWLQSGTLTVEGNQGGIITADGTGCYDFHLTGGELIINGGNYKSEVTCVQVEKGTAAVNGGHFEASGVKLDGNGRENYLLNCIDDNYKAGTAKIEVTGGTFVNFDPADNAAEGTTAEGATTNFAAEGYEAVYNEETGTYEVQADTTKLAKIVRDGNPVYYKTLQEAIGGANAGETVVILSNVKEDVVVAEGKNITLDLNGKTITNESGHTITNNGTLVIKDSSADAKGTVDNVTHGKAAVINNATCTILAGSFTRSQEAGVDAATSGGNSYYTIENFGSMTFGEEGGDNSKISVTNTGKYSSMIHNGWYSSKDAIGKAAEMTINSGTFTGGVNTVKNDEAGNLTITGGAFTCEAQHAVMNWNTAVINGGTFESTANAALYNGASESTSVGELTVAGGTFTSAAGTDIATSASKPGTVAVSGGSFSKVVPKDCCAKGFAPVTTPGENNMYTVDEGFTVTITKDGASTDTFVKSGGTFTIEKADGIVAYVEYDDKFMIKNIYQTGTDGSLKIENVTADIELTPMPIGVTIINGAQVRIGQGVGADGKVKADLKGSGLRFIATVDDRNGDLASLVDEDKGDEIGILIYPADVTITDFNTEITNKNNNIVVIPAKTYQDPEAKTLFSVALTNLDVSNYNRKFTAKPYVKLDGVYYTDDQAVTRSIYEVAAGLLVEKKTEGEANTGLQVTGPKAIEVLNAYLNQVGVRLTIDNIAETGTISIRLESEDAANKKNGEYSSKVAFFDISTETTAEGEGVYKITLTALGDATFTEFWNEYIRINNNNGTVVKGIKVNGELLSEANREAAITNEGKTLTFTFSYNDAKNAK